MIFKFRQFYFGRTPKIMRRGFEISWRHRWGFDLQIWNISIYWHYGAGRENGVPEVKDALLDA